MSTENEDLEITIPDDDAPPVGGDVQIQPEGEKKADSKPEAPPAAEDDGIEDLKRSLAAERSARAQAERERNEAVNTAHAARSETQETNLALVSNAITAVKETQTNLKTRLKQAITDGDVDLQAELQAELTTKAAELITLEQGKVKMEAQPKPEAPKPAATGSGDPVEDIASQLSTRSAAWIRAHPHIVQDPDLYAAMLHSHNLAVKRGLVPDSDDYFRYIEHRLDEPSTGATRTDPQTQTQESPLSEAAGGQRRDAAPPAAPVSRSGSGDGSRPNVVRLSSDEREMAEVMFPDEKDPYTAYARNKLALQREGKITTH